MDALLMCGGRGSRHGGPVEKPLVRIGGTPMIDRVVDAVEASRIDTAVAIVSPNARATARHVADRLPVVRTAGDGYVPDLLRALEHVDPPVLTVAADLPLLTGSLVDAILDRAGEQSQSGSVTIGVPVARKRALGLRVEAVLPTHPEVAPTGVNVVGTAAVDVTPVEVRATGPAVTTDDPGTVVVIDDPRLAVNVNRPRDAMIAEAIR